MKNASIIFIIMFSCNMNSQTILPLYNQSFDDKNAYYKDIDNDFEKVMGTWEYTGSNSSLTITFKKKTKVKSTHHGYYKDFVIGEYKYIENNIEKINTLSNFYNHYNDPYKYNIVGNSIIRNDAMGSPPCNECGENERRINLMFDDPSNNIDGLSGRIVLRRIDEGGQEKLEMKLYQTGNIIYSGDTPPENPQFTVPFGEYILTKLE